jgi:hypothetical protein
VPKKSARPFANLKQHSTLWGAGQMVTANGEDYPDRSNVLLAL